MKKTDRIKNQEGVIAIVTILLISFLVSMTLILSSIFIPKIRASAEIKRSVSAIYAADSAAEWCLYIARKGAIAAPVMQNNASYTPTVSTACVSPLKTIGTYQSVSRAFELSF